MAWVIGQRPGRSKNRKPGQIRRACRPMRVVIKHMDAYVPCEKPQQASAAKRFSIWKLS